MTVETESVHLSSGATKKLTYGGGATDPSQDYAKKMKERMGQSNAEAPKKTMGVYVKIPSRYADPAKSPLRLTLQAGDRREDLKLSD